MEKRNKKYTIPPIVIDGVLISSEFCFGIPEGFYLRTAEDSLWEFCKTFNGTDVAYIIAEYYFTENSEEEELDSYKEDMEVDSFGEYFKVKRGKGVATAGFFGLGSEKNYIEKYKFDKNDNGYNIFSVTFEYHSQTGKAPKSLREVMDLPEVKRFFDTIQYS